MKKDNLKLIQGDCMDVMKDYPDNYFDLAIVDPPYGIDVTSMEMGGRKRNTQDKKKNWDCGVPDDSYFNELFRASKNQIIWGGNYFNLPPSQYFCVWDKGETMYGRSFAECELAWIRSGGTRILKKNPNQLDRIHPTQKPIILYEWLYKNYATKDMKVLDTHLGSGSNAISAYYFGVSEFVGVELDEDYFKAACKRVDAQTNQLKLF